MIRTIKQKNSLNTLKRITCEKKTEKNVCIKNKKQN